MIYFWRKRKNIAKGYWEMQLWKYDVQTDKLEQVIYNEVFENGKVHNNVDLFSVPCLKHLHKD